MQSCSRLRRCDATPACAARTAAAVVMGVDAWPTSTSPPTAPTSPTVTAHLELIEASAWSRSRIVGIDALAISAEVTEDDEERMDAEA